MVVLGEKVLGVSLHGEAASVCRVVPCYVNASKFLAFPVSADSVVVLQGSKEVVSMPLIDILNAKVIYDDHKHDGVPLVLPQAGCGSTLIVAMLSESVGEQVVGQFTCLLEAADTFVSLRG